MKNIIGKTVKSVSYPSQYDRITIYFTDGTKLEIKEIGYTGEIRVRVNDEEKHPEEED